MMNERDRQILQIALPAIVSNITVPLLGMIDVAIVGHMGSAAYMGAVAVGSMSFNLIYWLFGFLRMGASGMTAQALGRRDLTEVSLMLVRSLTAALAIALLIVGLQYPLCWLMFQLIGPTPDVAPYAVTYFHIVVWGAPASLCLFSLSGWYIGMQNTRIPMVVSIVQNVVNILASLVLVYGLGLKVEGVAYGTVIAQYAGLLMAAVPLLRSSVWQYFRCAAFWHGWERLFTVNRDIFLRTICLVGVNFYFTSMGARSGAVILSVNTVMMQFYLFYSYFMDGFAYAGEALCGKAFGGRRQDVFRSILRRLFGWAAGVTLCFTLFYVVGGQWLLEVLTDEAAVRAASRDYLWWTWLVPAAGALAFVWDGVFIGMTATRGMLVSSFVSTLVFFGVCLTGHELWGNHGLWLAQVVYLTVRGVIQTVWYRQRIVRDWK